MRAGAGQQAIQQHSSTAANSSSRTGSLAARQGRHLWLLWIEGDDTFKGSAVGGAATQVVNLPEQGAAAKRGGWVDDNCFGSSKSPGAEGVSVQHEGSRRCPPPSLQDLQQQRRRRRHTAAPCSPPAARRLGCWCLGLR